MFLLSPGSWYSKRTRTKGLGIFTKNRIQQGMVIGDYLGRVIKTADYDVDEDKNGLYLMYYTDDISIYPDLHKPDIHLINHSCILRVYGYRLKYGRSRCEKFGRGQ